jgi:hypothetical protein
MSYSDDITLNNTNFRDMLNKIITAHQMGKHLIIFDMIYILSSMFGE